MAYGSFVLMRDLNFVVEARRYLHHYGRQRMRQEHAAAPSDRTQGTRHGRDHLRRLNFTRAEPAQRERLLRRFGVLYQSGALWSSMTLAENIGLPLGEFTDLTPAQIREIAALKLALVGLKGFEDFYPNQISGGMQKRAGLARAMALDPDILFFDEPSAGLDPISSRAARRSDPRTARQSWRDDRRGHPRAGQHLYHRQQQRLPGRRVAHPDRNRRSA